jgi:hypothetical protein
MPDWPFARGGGNGREGHPLHSYTLLPSTWVNQRALVCVRSFVHDTDNCYKFTQLGKVLDSNGVRFVSQIGNSPSVAWLIESNLNWQVQGTSISNQSTPLVVHYVDKRKQFVQIDTMIINMLCHFHCFAIRRTERIEEITWGSSLSCLFGQG